MTSTTEDLRRAIFTLAVSGIMVILVTDSASKQRSVTSIAALDNSSALHVKVDLLVRSVDRYGNRKNNEQLPGEGGAAGRSVRALEIHSLRILEGLGNPLCQSMRAGNYL